MDKKGVSMISLVITIVLLIILSSIAVSSSSTLIDDSVDATKEADMVADNDEIRKLLTYAVIDENMRTGIALYDGSLTMVNGENSYGTGYYVLAGGDYEEIEVLREAMGIASIVKYKGLTAPYVVNYEEGTFERIEIEDITEGTIFFR